MSRRAANLGAALRALALVMPLAACGSDGWFGDEEPPPLPGERIPVLLSGAGVEPDPRLADLPVELPAAARNEMWPQAGGYPNHAMGHLALADAPREAWRADIGDTGEARLAAAPIVVDGRVFALDGDAEVVALDAGSGRSLWRTAVRPEKERGDAMGGGVGFGEGRLVASTGYGEVLALDPASGEIAWRTRVAGPVRGAPTVAGGRVFVVTVDNQLAALSLADGAPLWNHTGILETASLLGSPSPASDGTIVVAPYSSGEIVGLRVENGRVVWFDNLAPLRRVGTLAGLADIRGAPVIDRGLVLAVSHGGRMVGIDQRTGARVWEQPVGGIEMPWAAGDFVFVVTNDAEVVALTRQAGRVKWVAPLPRWEDPEDREGAIVWKGPVLAGGRLWVAGTNGQLVALAPETGEIVAQRALPAAAVAPPVVANGTLYVLTEGGTLVAYR